jgi:hypothetical protein
MFTSYFARLRLGIEYPVSICRWPPKWYTGKRYFKLAPPKDILLNAKQNQEELEKDTEKFKEEYRREVLSRLDFDEVMADLRNMYPDIDDFNKLTLLCFEALDKPCHRHWAAEWFREHRVECGERVF